MRRFTLTAVIPLALCLACSDEFIGPEPAQFDELCGEAKPLQLLALDPQKPLHTANGVAYGDRYVVSLRFEGDTGAREVWSVGRCGETPVLLADDLDEYTAVLRDYWPNAPMICSADTHELVALDPQGLLDLRFDTPQDFRG